MSLKMLEETGFAFASETLRAEAIQEPDELLFQQITAAQNTVFCDEMSKKYSYYGYLYLGGQPKRWARASSLQTP
jgi:hypothetical protein